MCRQRVSRRWDTREKINQRELCKNKLKKSVSAALYPVKHPNTKFAAALAGTQSTAQRRYIYTTHLLISSAQSI